MEFKDYYSTLGVAKTASEKEIKQAFRKLARKHHPDVNPGDKAAETKFKEINEAYEVLGDPAKRKKYDELGANWRMYEQAGAPGGAGHLRRPVERQRAAAPQAGYRTMSQEEMEELFGDAHPFSDFFTTFFGGGFEGAERSAWPRPRAVVPGSARARRRARARADARGCVSRRDAAPGAEARRSVANRRRAHPGRRR